MRSLARALLVACLIAPTLTPAAMADRDDHFHGGWHGDIRHFNDHDFGRWRGGHWVHGYHGGQFGWWWNVGPTWYAYPAPVYPYPNPYVPPVVVPPAPPPQAWYYCGNPQGYYPYVAQCSMPWRAVPAR